jgi:hypothetical protein
MKLIERMNESKIPVLAVDVPSGLNADSGLPLDVAVRAHCTLSLGRSSKVCSRRARRRSPGRLEVAEEIACCLIHFRPRSVLTQASDFEHFPLRRPHLRP